MNEYKKLNNLVRAEKYFDALRFLLSLNKDKIPAIDEKLSIDSFLFNYFSKETNYSIELEERLANQYPFRFVKAVRTSQVFIKKNRLKYLKEIHLSEPLNVHKKVWYKLQEAEEILWKRAESNLKDILDLNIKDVLSDVVFWLETERYHSDSQAKQVELASVYSFFINYYLYHTEKTINIDLSKQEFSEFDKTFFERFKNQKIDPKISNILNSIRDWVNFNTNTIQAYCYDLNIEPKLENGIIYFNQHPTNYYKWQIDGIRYGKIKMDYQQKATLQVIDDIKSEKLIIPGKNEEQFDNNVQGAIRQRKMELFLKDLNIYDSPYGKIEKGLFKIFSSILGFSFNRFYRYEKNLDKIKKTSTNWYEAYLKLFSHSLQIQTEILPYLLMSKSEYIKRTENIFHNFEPSVFGNAFKLLSYKVLKNKEFDRFRINYDVWYKPFVKIGKVYFSPMLFFSNNDWFYSSSQVAIEVTNKNPTIRKKTATEMENYLADKFLQKGFKVKVINDRQANKIDGDVDIIVEDNDTVLFIQLKRTYFRLNPKDAYYESMTSDKRASKQLNDAVKSLEKDNEFYTINRSPKKWIVSTSFEFINTDIGSCNKINYFELLFALENNDLKSLRAIIYNLEKDNNLLSFYNVKDDDFKTQEQLMNIVGLPIELVEPRKYLSPVFADKNYNEEYNKLFSKAIELYTKNDKKAIKILKQCLLINKDDIEVYGALGNCYANLKNLPNLTSSFEKALEIIPNEPYIKRNYALALIENKQYYKGILMLQELHNDFNLVGDFTMIFIMNYDRYKNQLTDKENEIINAKWMNN